MAATGTAPGAHLEHRAVTSRLSPYAWGAVGAVAAFIGLTCWWLTQDRSIPVYDAGYHLSTAIRYHDFLQAGRLLEPFTHVSQYPPLGHLVGALAAFIGGVNVASPIIGENVVFVSLLALGTYQTGRLLFGPPAGLLAVVVALGSPLLIAQFHVFMLDAPEAAMVAVSLWLLLASEDFDRTRVAALAGLAVGLGLNVKVQFPLYLAGVVIVMLARGGWRHWRGLAAFAAVALVIGAPWYLAHLGELSRIQHIAGSPAPENNPATLSTTNFAWYFWSTLNTLLLAPLFLLAAGGAIWTVLALVRRRIASGPALALLVGLVLAWLAVTLTPDKDVRFGEPLLPYLAVIGTGWIVALAPLARAAATAVVVLAVVANTLATTFGVGGQVKVALVSSPPISDSYQKQIVLYSNAGFQVAGPKRDGNVPGLLRALRRDGVRTLALGTAVGPPTFSKTGLTALAKIARIAPSSEPAPAPDAAAAALVHQVSVPGGSAPCTRLSDGSGVWVLRFDPATRAVAYFCPLPRARYYG